MTGITIRPGRLEDAEIVRSFTEDTFAWGDYVGREFPTWLERPDEMAIVAADNTDSPVAVARVGLLSEAEAWLAGAQSPPPTSPTGDRIAHERFRGRMGTGEGSQGDPTCHRR